MGLLFEYYNTLGPDIKDRIKLKLTEDLKNEIFLPKKTLLENGKDIDKRSSKILLNLVENAYKSQN